MGILVLGDLFYDYDYISEDILELEDYIKKNSLSVVLNLEGSLAVNKSNPIKKRGENLAQNHKVIEVLKRLNVKGVSLCNNHMFDFGVEGFKETIEILKKNNIKYCGAGLYKAEAAQPMIIEDNGIKYAFYAATDPFEESVCCKNGRAGCLNISDLQKTKILGSEDIVKIAFLHTGFEYNTLPCPRTINECRSFIDYGFDSVICSHPHITQPYEVYSDKTIYYSLGNFYFSSFRDEFQKKQINNFVAGYCNLGYGVLLDKQFTATVGVFYDPKLNKSYFEARYTPKELNTYLQSDDYVKLCKENRNNHNPILSGNPFKDKFEMGILNFEYLVYGFLKKLGVSKIIKKIGLIK